MVLAATAPRYLLPTAQRPEHRRDQAHHPTARPAHAVWWSCGSARSRSVASCAARASAKSSAHDSTSGRRRSSARRSRSVMPPQTPNSIRWSSACARHSVRTGQTRQKLPGLPLFAPRDEEVLGVGRPATRRTSPVPPCLHDPLPGQSTKSAPDQHRRNPARLGSFADGGIAPSRPRARTLRRRDVSPPARATDRPFARFVPGRGRADRRDRVPRRRGARARVQRRGRHGHHGLHRRRRRPVAAHHHRHRRRGQSDRPVLRAQPEPAGRHVRSDLARDEGRHHRDRGSPLLPAQRRRLAGHDPRGHRQLRVGRRRAGGLDAHPAVRQELLPLRHGEDRDPAAQGHRTDLRAQAQGGADRAADGAGAVEGGDPHPVPEHRLVRQRGRRGRRGRPHVLQHHARQAHGRAGRRARWHGAQHRRHRPGHEAAGRARPAQPRHPADARAADDRRRAGQVCVGEPARHREPPGHAACGVRRCRRRRVLLQVRPELPARRGLHHRPAQPRWLHDQDDARPERLRQGEGFA